MSVEHLCDGDVTLHVGDCLDVMRGMADSSVDAVITDPPYGLEFMGAEWDAPWRKGDDINTDAGFKGGGTGATRNAPSFTGSTNSKCLNCKGTLRGRRDGTAIRKVCTCNAPRFPNVRAIEAVAFQAWCQLWAAECLRVLKPGGHLLAFGGTRTWHRLCCAIEDAGFEIRDSISWVYACLPSDTEVLTPYGWKLGIEVEEGDPIAQWNPTTERITLAPVLDTFRGPWNGPMRILRNADTDQMVTPNHRIYHRSRQRQMVDGHRSAWFEKEWQVEEARHLSTWNSLRLPLSGEHEGPGIGGDDYAALLGWVWTEGGFDLSGTGVRIYQSSVNTDKVTEIASLMDRLSPHKRYDQQRVYTRRNGEAHPHTAATWYFSGDLARRVRADLPGKRPTYGLLWRMTGREKAAMLRAAMLGDGSGWGTHGEQFYQQHEDDLVWLQTLLALIGRAGKIGMRGNRPGGAVYLRRRGDTELQARHLRTAWEDYTGEVWCVKVPSGAFLVRRNGRVFVTGNSGFPKSLDVSKAIDRAAGAEREVVGVKPGHENFVGRDNHPLNDGWDRLWASDPEAVARYHALTAPATDDARRWSGWGTALKPAHEPIVVARKPMAGTVASNVLTWGTGAINVDATRVHTPGSEATAYTVKRLKPGATLNRTGGNWRPESADAVTYEGQTTAGRWPSNLVISHAATPDGADLCVDGCVDGCPVQELDAQSGESVSPGTYERSTVVVNHVYGASNERFVQNGHGDTGGASRFFPVFRFEPKAPSSERPRILSGGGTGKVALTSSRTVRECNVCGSRTVPSGGRPWPACGHEDWTAVETQDNAAGTVAHPTVKPLDLMRWLVRLVTPPGGTVLDLFLGSGTTAEACVVEGFRCIGIEREADYLPLIRARLAKPIAPVLDFGGA